MKQLTFARWALILCVSLLWGGVASPLQAQSLVDPHLAALENGPNWSSKFPIPGVPFQEVTSLAVDAQGKVYACCTSPTFGQYEVLMWDGASWSETGSRFNREPAGLVTHNSTLYAIGGFEKTGGTFARGFAQWDGSKWTRVGSGVGPTFTQFENTTQGEVYAAAIYQDMLVVGGAFDSIDGVKLNHIAAWNGETWLPIGEGIAFSEGFAFGQGIYALATDGNTLFAGGEFVQAGGIPANNIARWDGAAWHSLGSGIDQSDEYDQRRVTALAAGGGKLYAAGTFSGAGGKEAANIAVWNGSAWNSLGDGLQSNLNTEIHALLLDGTILYAGGKFAFAGGESIANFARFANNQWQSVPDGVLQEYDKVRALVQRPGGGLYIGGSFTNIAGLLAHNVAAFSGTSWDVFGQGLTTSTTGGGPGRIYALAADPEGYIYAGGFFVTAGGITVNNIARWDGIRWESLGSGVSGDGGLNDGTVRALAFYNGELYVGGQFTTAGGMPAKHLAKWNLTTRQWSPVGGGVDGEVYALTTGHNRLYVGGNFKTVGNLSVDDVAYWNGSAWGAPSQSLRIFQVFDNCNEQGTQVYALAVWQNMLVIGGDFRLVYTGGDICAVSSYRPANHMLLWDAVEDTWNFTGSGPIYGVGSGGGAFGRPVSALAVIDTDVYVGGGFGTAGGINVSRLARFNHQGWSDVGGGVSGAANTCALCSGPEVLGLLAAGSKLYVTGDFLNTGGGPANNIAAYDTNTQQWQTFESGLNKVNTVSGHALALGQDGLYVGGDFEQAGARNATGISRWSGIMNTKPIGAQGGSFDSQSGVRITFPGGAVAEDVEVQFVPLAANGLQLPANVRVLNSFRFTARNSAGTHVTQFAQPYTLQIDYPQGSVDDPEQLNVYMRSNGGEWKALLPCTGCSVNPATGTITIVADHFSEFAVTAAWDDDTDPTPEGPALYIPTAQR